MTAAPATDAALTREEQDAADALWAAVAAGTLYALLRSSSAQRLRTIERMIIRHERILDDIAALLEDGVITLAQWERRVQAELRPLHLAAVAATAGGFALLTQAHVQAYRAEIVAQFRYLRTFRQQLASAEQLMNGTFRSRLRLYARAAHGVAQQVNRRFQQVIGKTEERRILGAADHCRSCLDEAAKGWAPIGTLRRIGDSECRTNCRCRWSYR